MTELQPHVVAASAYVARVLPFGDGYVALTSAGIERFDANLTPTGIVPGGAVGNLDVLADGRCLSSSSSFHVCANDAWENVESGGFLRQLVIARDRRGFFALGPDRIVIDRDSVRSTLEIEKDRLTNGGALWRDGLVLSGHGGLTMLDGAGAETVRSGEVFLTKAPVVVGDHVFCSGTRELCVFDENAQRIATFDFDANGELLAFANGVLVRRDHEGEPSTLTLWGIADGTPVEQWSVEVPHPVTTKIAGDWLVVSTLDDDVYIIDATGAVREELKLDIVRDVAVFEDGLALATDAALVWWRDGEDLVTLEHDVRGSHPATAPLGLLSAESHAIYLWRTDVQGPPATTFVCNLPLGVPLVIGGGLVTLESAGRFGMRARNGEHRYLVRPDGKPWRHATTREEAIQIMQRLIGRVFDGPLPALPTEGTFDDVTRVLAQYPLSETMDLYGRSWFQQSTFDKKVLFDVLHARDAFLAELSDALDTPPRVLAAQIRARKLKLEPPKPVDDRYDYVGAFTSSGTLTVADPCYIGKASNHPALGFQLALKVAGHEGMWHAFIRDDEDSGRNAELVVVHDSAFGVYASESIGSVGVDGGAVGVFDKAYKHDRDLPFDDGVVGNAGGLGAVARSGYGDGMYAVLVGTNNGRVGKIRVSFIDDSPEIDRLIAKPVAAAKPYSAKEKFAVGDSIQHVKFGVGSVIRVADGKIDVRFDDDTRTLVHAKK